MSSGIPRAQVRVNFGGKRYLGMVELPPPLERVSDVLNDGLHFLYLHMVQTDGTCQGDESMALNKHHITHVQAIEEALPPNPSLIVSGDFIEVDVLMQNPFMQIRGHIFVPDGTRGPSEVINDARDFLSLRNVTLVGAREEYPYLALSKAQVVSITVAESASASV